MHFTTLETSREAVQQCLPSNSVKLNVVSDDLADFLHASWMPVLTTQAKEYAVVGQGGVRQQ